MDKFVRSIRVKYKERRLSLEKQWPPCKSEKLIRLELVEKEAHSATQRQVFLSGRESKGLQTQPQLYLRESEGIKRTPLAYSDLFWVEQGKKPVRKVLVEGGAGIGKTTLCIALSEDWANEKLFQEFGLLVLLPLRQKRVASAGSLSELLTLLHPSVAVRTAVASYMEEREGENVLIIADGWDELCEVDRVEGSFLFELLFGFQYCLMSVVLTSRPSASGPLHRLPCIDRFVEVRGFSKDNIEQYIRSEFDGEEAKSSGLLEQLESNPIVESVCSVPLNCAILCHLWRTLEEALPTTMTELYTKIILNIIFRNVRKIPDYDRLQSLSHFSELPDSLRHWWWCLCELAFRALEKNKIVLSSEDFATFLPKGLPFDDKILCFGLLQKSESILEVGVGVSFHFLHLTFQEYLAALYLVRQSSDTQLHYCQSLAMASSFAMVWRFYFGMGKWFPTVSFVAQKEIIKRCSLTDALTLCHCSYEAQDTAICSELQYHFQCAHTSYDCSAIVHVIANTEENSDMRINFSNCCVGDKNISKLTDALASKKGKLQVTTLYLDGNKLTDKGVCDLFNRASAAFKTLVDLNLGQNRIGSEGVNSALFALSRSNAGDEGVYFVVSDNPLTLSGMNALDDTFHSLKFRNINLSGCLTDNEQANADWICSFGRHLSVSVLDSGELVLSRNRLGVLGAKALGKVIPQDFSIPKDLARLSYSRCFSLDLRETMLGDEGVAAFTESIAGVCVLSTLDLSNNNIHAAGIYHLANCFHGKQLSIVHFLRLSDNPLQLEGVVALCRMLRCDYCRPVSVVISGCKLTTAEDEGSSCQRLTCVSVGQWLCSQVLRACTVQCLNLSNTCFTGEGIHILVGFMSLCPCLQQLYCQSCGISSDDLMQLLIQLSKRGSKSQLLSLCLWSLRDNDIDDRGVSALIHHLHNFLKSIYIHLENNPINQGAINQLMEVVQARRMEYYKSVEEEPTGNYPEFDPQRPEFRTQWEVIVTHMYQLAMDPTFEPMFSTLRTPLQLEVVREPHRRLSEETQTFAHADKRPSTFSEHDNSTSASDMSALTQERGARAVGTQRNSLDQYPVKDHDHWAASDWCSGGENREVVNEHTVDSKDTGQCCDIDREIKEVGGADGVKHAVDSKESAPDLLPISHHLVDLVQWKDDTGKIHQLKIYSETAHRWSHIATRLGFSHGRIENLWSDYRKNYDRLTAVLGEWFDNAASLPNAHLYPLSWEGLVKLLNDCELSEVANKLSAALDASSSNVRGNLVNH